jgi:hypothetical protein
MAGAPLGAARPSPAAALEARGRHHAWRGFQVAGESPTVARPSNPSLHDARAPTPSAPHRAQRCALGGGLGRPAHSTLGASRRSRAKSRLRHVCCVLFRLPVGLAGHVRAQVPRLAQRSATALPAHRALRVRPQLAGRMELLGVASLGEDEPASTAPARRSRAHGPCLPEPWSAEPRKGRPCARSSSRRAAARRELRRRLDVATVGLRVAPDSGGARCGHPREHRCPATTTTSAE